MMCAQLVVTVRAPGAAREPPLPKLNGAWTVGDVGTVAHGLRHLLAAPAFLAHHLVDGGEATPIVPAVQADHVGLGAEPHGGANPPVPLGRGMGYVLCPTRSGAWLRQRGPQPRWRSSDCDRQAQSFLG